VTLADLQANDSATIGTVHGDRPVVRRLLELGLVPGTRVRMLRVAPLGDPLELMIRGYRLSIRRDDARQIMVTPT